MRAYGYVRGPSHDGLWVPVAASLKVYPAGGFWVYLDANGRVSLCLNATANVFGWAEFPTSLPAGSTAASNGYWTSSSTAGADKVFVHTNPNTVFAMPCTSGTVWAQARLGELLDITGVATADGSAQEANPGTNSTDILVAAGGDDNDTSVIYVRMNEDKIQKDT